MLGYASSGAVTKNAAEKKLCSLLEFISSSKQSDMLQRFYELTLQSNECQHNERLWSKAHLKLCDLWFTTENFGPLKKALADLQQACPPAGDLVDIVYKNCACLWHRPQVICR